MYNDDLKMYNEYLETYFDQCMALIIKKKIG